MACSGTLWSIVYWVLYSKHYSHELTTNIVIVTGSLIVVASALIVWLTEWPYKLYIDPALSLVLVILILVSVWPLLRESALILLQTVPTHIQVSRP